MALIAHKNFVHIIVCILILFILIMCALILHILPIPLFLSCPNKFILTFLTTVNTLLSLPPTHSHSHCQVFISGGHGLEDINKARACDNVSETEGVFSFGIYYQLVIHNN